jgi:hypothetical protein
VPGWNELNCQWALAACNGGINKQNNLLPKILDTLLPEVITGHSVS